MARIRSPNYPQLSLPEAVQRIEQVFTKERRHPAPKEVIIRHLGYGTVNGASLGALSALLKYGLLDRDGENFRVSDRAIAILHPATPDEKAEALRAAAFAPTLFAELMENFGGEIPSDENLTAVLVRRGFGNNAIGPVIQKLRDTIGMVQHVTYTQKASPPPKREPLNAPLPPAAESAQPKARRAESAWTVSLNQDSLEVAAGLLDQRSVDRLIAILQANKPLLPEKLEVRDPPAPSDDNWLGAGEQN